MQLARTKEWRESRGLTQRELAADAGVGEVTVARIEAGASVIPPTARKIAEALGISVADLLEHPPAPLAPARQEVGQPSKPEEQLIDRPEVRAWLAEEGHMSEEEFLDWAEDLDPSEAGIERGIEELYTARDRLLEALGSIEVRRALFPIDSQGLSKEE